MDSIPKLITFYLPQYYPIPENDQWWGKGFTEWTNVVKARPRFIGHHQPHLPADLGFYDLRLPEVRQEQAELAHKYGIYGFCYYHYWFKGKELLERPLHEVIKTGEPNFPFCICWANVNWTRTWDGLEKHILIAQDYSDEDDKDHIRGLIPVLMDSRYIRYKGKPLLLIYSASTMPNPKRTTDNWREIFQKMGLGELFLCTVESWKNYLNPKDNGFDAAVEFQPDWRLFQHKLTKSLFWRGLRKFKLLPKFFLHNTISTYEWLVEQSINKPKVDYLRFPCVTPGWDNSARRNKDSHILIRSTPNLYENWLTHVINEYKYSSAKEFVFINAWNEWGEGNHLEPDSRFGHAYLEATLNALKRSQNKTV